MCLLRTNHIILISVRIASNNFNKNKLSNDNLIEIRLKLAFKRKKKKENEMKSAECGKEKGKIKQ